MTNPVNESTTMLQSFDRGQFVARCLGNEALAQRLIDALVTTLPTERVAIHTAIDSNDLSLVARIAHRLKGTASNVGAVPLAQAACRLEQSARDEHTQQLADNWKDVCEQLDRVLSDLSKGA